MNRHLHTIISPLIIAPLALCIPQAYAASAAIPSPQEEHSSQPASESTEEETADQTVTDLDEFVVEGRTQRVVKNGVEYTPAKQTKKMARDATSLLQYMQIPQLNISPLGGSVTTRAGAAVAFFIDYIPASAQDLSGLRPEDVLSVEVLEYPSDPRFNGSEHVVNYIMRKYEWGGYTKLDVQGLTLASDLLSGTLYSKFTVKNWTIDANASSSIMHDNLTEAYTEETFRNFNFGDRHIDRLTRISYTPDDQLLKSNSQWASVRAMWAKQNTRIIHILSFSRNANPTSTTRSEVTFSDDILPPAESSSGSYSQNLSPTVRGNYFFNFNGLQSLLIDWSFCYSGLRSSSFYQLGDEAPINNYNKEHAYSPEVTLYYSRNFPRNNTLRAMFATSNSIYNTDYYGTAYSGRQDLLSSENLLFLEYMKYWDCGLNLYSRAGVSYSKGRLNGETILSSWNPRLGFQLQYRINQSNSADVSAWWGNSHPEPSVSNTAIVQTSELMWHTGNPDIKNILFASVFANYAYIPTNWLSFYANLSYVGNPRRTAYEFLVMPGYDGLVGRTVNSGTLHCYDAQLTGTVKLFNNSLNLQAGVKFNHTGFTGIDAQSFNYVSCNLSANYFIGNVALTLYYNSPQKYSGLGNNGQIFWNKSTYGVAASYSLRNFKADLLFGGWFGNGRQYSSLNSEHYSVYSWNASNNYSRFLRLTLSYTLPYGKLVDRNNELQTSGAVNSAILK